MPAPTATRPRPERGGGERAPPPTHPVLDLHSSRAHTHLPGWEQSPAGAVRLRASARRAPMPSPGPPPPKTSRPSPATPPARALGGGGASRAAPQSLSADRAGPGLEGRRGGRGLVRGGGATLPAGVPLSRPRLQTLSSADLRDSGDTPPTKGHLMLRAGEAHLLMERGTEILQCKSQQARGRKLGDFPLRERRLDFPTLDPE